MIISIIIGLLGLLALSYMHIFIASVHPAYAYLFGYLIGLLSLGLGLLKHIPK